MAKPSEQKIAQNMQLVLDLVKTFPDERRKTVAQMLRTQVGDEFFTCPASVRTDYHNAFPGGLCDHSLRVVDNLLKLTKIWAPNRWPDSTLSFVGLFHDLGKVGDGTNPYYIVKDSDWHKKQGIMYDTNKACLYMPTSERGLYLLQKFGISVTDEEYLAIRLNDGMYDETNKRYAMKEPDLAILVHMADRWSCTLEKQNA